MEPISSNQTATTTPTVKAATEDSGAAIASDFETFLTMLTAQAEYQDPLDPIDSAEYAAQLAQFSMVEQQVQTNELMQELISSLGQNGFAGLSSWIGKDALSTAPARFDGSPVTLSADPPATADEMILVVRDESGAEVQREVLAPTTDQITWAGVDAAGNPLPTGTYAFEFDFRAAGEELATQTARAYSTVTEARVEGDETFVILDSGHRIPASNVVGLRDPDNA